MTKVMTILGTRPEIIKMSRVISELDDCFDNILVHTGQNYDYELNEIFFNDLEVRKPDYFLLNYSEKFAYYIDYLNETIANYFLILFTEIVERGILYNWIRM